jgi:hypothetical protein
MYSLASAALADSLKQQVGSVQLRVPTSFPQRLGAALYVFCVQSIDDAASQKNNQPNNTRASILMRT